jgi:hypothetical protein
MKILKVISVTFLSICCYSNCFGQDYPTNDTVINKEIAQLQKKGIDTICTYQYYCPGAIRFIKSNIDTTCFHSDRADVYFLWKFKGATYMTLKNSCSSYDTIKVYSNRLWKFYSENKVKISTERTKPFQITAIRHGKKEMEYVDIDHSPRQEIMLNISQRNIKLYFDAFNLLKTTGDRNDDRININYSYNNSTKSNQFKIILEAIIKDVENKKLLKKVSK